LDSTGISRLASIASNYTHGTGDIRSLTALGCLMIVSSLVFFSLAHWSIAQTNNFMKDVYEPALRGEFEPLIVGALEPQWEDMLLKNCEKRSKAKDRRCRHYKTYKLRRKDLKEMYLSSIQHDLCISICRIWWTLVAGS